MNEQYKSEFDLLQKFQIVNLLDLYYTKEYSNNIEYIGFIDCDIESMCDLHFKRVGKVIDRWDNERFNLNKLYDRWAILIELTQCDFVSAELLVDPDDQIRYFAQLRFKQLEKF